MFNADLMSLSLKSVFDLFISKAHFDFVFFFTLKLFLMMSKNSGSKTGQVNVIFSLNNNCVRSCAVHEYKD